MIHINNIIHFLFKGCAMVPSSSHIIMSGSSSQDLMSKLSPLLSIEQARPLVSRFADGEFQIEIKENYSNKKVFLLQSTAPPVNEAYMELFLLLDACKQGQAKEVVVIMPYLGYSRQDRKLQEGSPISARCMIQILKTAGAKEIWTVDIHSEHTLSAFPGTLKNLEAQDFLADEISKQVNLSECICVSPDLGGLARVQKWAKKTSCQGTAYIEKERSKPNEAKALEVQGSVKGKNIIILDDMIDTAGTLVAAVDKLILNGAKDVSVVATHGLFSKTALDRINNSPIKQVWVSDSIPPKKEVLESKKIQIISLAGLLKSYIDSSMNKM